MINRKNMWLVTLFSVVLLLGIYYVTVPTDLLKEVSKTDDSSEVNLTIEETSIIETMKTEKEEETNEELETLETSLTNEELTTDQKNETYEKIKNISKRTSNEEKIEKKIKEDFECETYAKIDDSTVKVVVSSCEESTTTANNIMRSVQEEFENKMYITVQFK